MRTHRIKRLRIPYTWSEIARVVVVALLALSGMAYAALHAGNLP